MLADEPTGNLDSATGAQVLDLFSRLRDELGVTLVMATHDPAIAARADRELHIVDGKLTDPPAAPAGLVAGLAATGGGR